MVKLTLQQNLVIILKYLCYLRWIVLLKLRVSQSSTTDIIHLMSI